MSTHTYTEVTLTTLCCTANLGCGLNEKTYIITPCGEGQVKTNY